MTHRETPNLVRHIPRHLHNIAHITISLLTNTSKVMQIPEYVFWVCLSIYMQLHLFPFKKYRSWPI